MRRVEEMLDRSRSCRMKRKLLWLFIAGIAVGIVGIVLLICLIPLVKGLK